MDALSSAEKLASESVALKPEISRLKCEVETVTAQRNVSNTLSVANVDWSSAVLFIRSFA